MTHHHGHKDHGAMFNPANVQRLNSPERKRRMPGAAIAAASGLFPGIRVADIGSGAGYCSLALLDSGIPPARIDAVDASPEMNDHFRAALVGHLLRDRVVFHAGRGEQLPLADRSVDLVLVGNVFHEFENADRALSEFHRILAPSGRVLILDWAVPEDRSIEPDVGPAYDHRVPELTVREKLKGAGFADIQSHPGFLEIYALSARKP